MQSNGKFFYINGDSWLSHYVAKVANSDHPLFKDTVVINHSVPGSGNADIISRTKYALTELKKYQIFPTVCVGLTEVGRNFNEEFALARPQENLTEYLRFVLMQQINILDNMLTGYKHYVGTAWLPDPRENKSLIDFIDEDFSDIAPVYTVGNGIYQWLHDRRKIFKFSKDSFFEAVENKQVFEKRLLKNKYVNETMHLDRHNSDIVYQKYFEHVFLTTKDTHDN